MYRGSCQVLCEVSLLLSWRLVKNGAVIAFQIRFGGKKQHSPTSSLAQDEGLREKVGVWFCSAEVRAGEVVTGLKSLHYLAWGHNRSPLDFLHAAVPENDCSCSWLSAGISPERGQKHRGVLPRTQTCVPRTRKP